MTIPSQIAQVLKWQLITLQLKPRHQQLLPCRPTFWWGHAWSDELLHASPPTELCNYHDNQFSAEAWFSCLCQIKNKVSSHRGIHTNQILLSSNRLEVSPWSFTHVFKKIETTMRWNCMSKALRLVQITVGHQDCLFFTVFLTIKTSSQNISITLLQISLKLHEYRGGYCRKKLQ